MKNEFVHKVNDKTGVNSKKSPSQNFARLSSSYTPIQQLHSSIGNQAVQKLFEQGSIQAKLKIGNANDKYEQEADRVADQVMRMPDTSTTEQSHNILSSKTAVIQRLCPECDEELKLQPEVVVKKEEEGELLQTKEMPGQPPAVSHELESTIKSIRGGGQPISSSDRRFFEPRFGQDFGQVRIHNDAQAANVARSINARAFTLGKNVVFGSGEYTPGTGKGRHLLAHELTHVMQQGSVPNIQQQSVHDYVPHVQRHDMGTRMASHVVQRVPGDGMLPPGDCSWATYLILRGSVETAKAVVSTLGACRVGDSCTFLAAKIAAITAEVAARIALDATCFRGGNTGHRRQVQDKINMMKRCYRFFSASGCPPELIAAMVVVVESARAVIAAGAVVVAVALVVALIVAIIALAEVILALIAAAAAATAAEAAAAAALAAVIALLVLIKDELAPEDSSSA